MTLLDNVIEFADEEGVCKSAGQDRTGGWRLVTLTTPSCSIIAGEETVCRCDPETAVSCSALVSCVCVCVGLRAGGGRGNALTNLSKY